MNNCGRCGQHVASAYLCDTCATATIRALTIFAPIVGDLRAMMTDLRATPSDEVRVDGTRERKLGADFDLAGRADLLYATVANWAIGWALALEISPPAHLERFGADNAVVGLPRSGPAFLSAQRVSSWLISNQTRLEASPDAGLYAIEITDAIAAEATAIGYRPRVRSVPGRLCRVCDSPTLKHSWPINGEPRLRCTACGEVMPCGPALTRAVLEER